jgi:hypothetical protein
MPAYYVYLISSLPVLAFGAKPPFSEEDFFELCLRSIPAKEVEKIREAVNTSGYEIKGTGVFNKWRVFDLSLRNELAHARSGRLKKDPLKYVRDDLGQTFDVGHIAMSAYRNANIIEAERFLDLSRWRFLDDLSTGHYFDMELIFIYALKLKILSRWDKINNSESHFILTEVLKRN